MATAKNKIQGEQKCSYSCCNEKSSVKVKNNWGSKVSFTHFCKGHQPNWVSNGLKKSPETTMFGVKKSWYQIAE